MELDKGRKELADDLGHEDGVAEISTDVSME
jgi:hypothetical protein